MKWRTLTTWLAVLSAAACCFAAGAFNDDDLTLFAEEVGDAETISIDGADDEHPPQQVRAPRSVQGYGSGDDSDDEDDFDDGPVGPGTASTSVLPPAAAVPPPLRSFPTNELEEGSGGRGVNDDEEFNFFSTVAPFRPTDSYRSRGGFGGADSAALPPLSNFALYDEEEEEPVKVVTNKPVNRGPYVQRKLPKYPVTAGKSIRIIIPEDTFFDPEEGNTRRLRLDLRHEDGSPVRNSWLRFDPKKQAIYALPVNENNIGKWRFILRASDPQGETAKDTLEIVVRQYKRSRLVNHQFSIKFSFTDWDPASTRNWQWVMLDKVQRLYGDRKPTNIIVREAKANPYVFSWTNDTLTMQSCPRGDIEDLFGLLSSESEGGGGGGGAMSGKKPSRRLKALLGDKFFVKSVAMSLHGTCLYAAGGGDLAGGSPLNNPNNKVGNGADESVPVMRNPIDRINVTAGELLRYKVPEDTCYDKEDGGTERLNLQLLTPSRRELPPDAWLQFDPRNQEFVGIPLEEEVGRSEYQLVCSDQNGLSAIDGIEVIVHNRPFSESFPVEFAFVFSNAAADRSGFRTSKVRIVESVARYFGDSTPSNVVLETFEDDGDDGNRMVWFNKSLAHVGCDHEKLIWAKNMLLGPEGKVRPELVAAFGDDEPLELVDVEVVERGRCVAAEAAPAPSNPTVMTPGGDTGIVERGKGGSAIFHGIIPSTDYLLTFIIPAVIITCMLILAILLACVLHKKRKAGKLSLFYSESLPPRVPVILQDELFDDNDAGVFEQQPEENFRSGSLVRMHHQHQQQEEADGLLLHRQFAPSVTIDPYSKGSLSRPTPAYQRRPV